MPLKYEHTQKAKRPSFLSVLFSLVLASSALLFWLLFTDATAVTIGIVIAFTLLIGTMQVMAGLKITIDDNFIQIRCGITVSKKLLLSQIADCRPVSSDRDSKGAKFYAEYALAKFWNMQGVELTFKNGKRIRIGTDEPEKLAEAIQDAISQTPKAAV